MDSLKKLILLEKEASDFGFKWENAHQILQQISSEIPEIEVHLLDHNSKKLQEEIGDLFHAVCSLCVFSQLDPYETLEKSVEKFERRLVLVKQLVLAQGKTSLNGSPFDDLMGFWKKAKEIENNLSI